VAGAQAIKGELGLGHQVKGIGAQGRVGGPPGRQADKARGQIERDGLKPCGALGAELIEKARQGSGRIAGAGPHHPPALLAGHHRQVAVPAPVADLIDPDAAKAVQAVGAGTRLGHQPAPDPPDRLPVDPQELGHHALGGRSGQPGAGVLQGAAEARPRPGPGDLLLGNATGRAAHPRQAAFEHHPRPAQIAVAPAADPVIVHRARRHAAAPAARAMPARERQAHHQLGSAARLGQLQIHHPGAGDPEQALE
jgi:hypothetical protein